ncbi:MAG: (d)CMP kinase, partial [Clostridia bacterium]|nr:(d)CMP kinase [Clostridia bacterium]
MPSLNWPAVRSQTEEELPMKKIFSIALDGPAGAGKSSIAEAVAQEMNA